MESVTVMEVAPVPDPPIKDASPLRPPSPLEGLTLRRSTRCLNRPRPPCYTEQEPLKPASGRGRGGGKRKKDEEKQGLLPPPPALDGKRPYRKPAAAVETGEGKSMPVIEAAPISFAGVAEAAAGDDVMECGKSAKLRVKETLRAFNSHYLHFVQVAYLCV
jgi:[histone H3]-lysine9 N-trimethyltransferase EHMT